MLDLVIHAFNVGRTPEEIVQSYDTLNLEDVYAVLAYYLAYRGDVDAYIQEQEVEADVLWKDIKKRTDYQEFRSRLLVRRFTSQGASLLY